MTTSLPHVRVADPADRPEIIAMIEDHHFENNFLFKLDHVKINEMLDKHYNRAGGIVGVIGATGQLEASCALVFSDYWCSGDWHICELFNYVKPQYRNSSNADSLMEFAKQCSLKIGLPLVSGVFACKQTAAKVRLYRRRYGSAAGAFFVFNAPQAETMPDRDFMLVFEPEEDRQRRRREERRLARKNNGMMLAPALQTANATGLVMQ